MKPRTPAPEELLGWTRAESPFHAGEKAVQGRVGLAERMERAGRRMIRDFLPAQHRDFFEHQSWLVVGSLDEAGQPWASVLAGPEGFVRSPDPHTLDIAALPAGAMPLARHLAVGAPLGLLGIELASRRRNRANGVVTALSADSFRVRVQQSFGNCKQYIQAREVAYDAERAGSERGAARAEAGSLSAEACALLASCDTFFIATASRSAREGGAGEGVDVSHRGGKPGFVRVQQEAFGSRLVVPDFSGNNVFNTFGNLEVEPRAAIVCVDFSSGDVLSLTGRARVVWDTERVNEFEGAERLLEFDCARGVWLEEALPLRWSAPEPSPYLDATGQWPESRSPRP